MDHFIEAALEWLFGIAKDTPDDMPELNYLEAFTVKYPLSRSLGRIVLSVILTVLFSVLFGIVTHETRFLFLFFSILFSAILLLSLYTLSYRCRVDEKCLVRSTLGIFRKRLDWDKVTSVKVMKQINEKSVTIALSDGNNNYAMDFLSEMQNAWYVVKMAEVKGIAVTEQHH